MPAKFPAGQPDLPLQQPLLPRQNLQVLLTAPALLPALLPPRPILSLQIPSIFMYKTKVIYLQPGKIDVLGGGELEEVVCYAYVL